MRYFRICLLFCLFLQTLAEDPRAEKNSRSVLLVSSAYVGHQLPLAALGEELVSRGNRVAFIGFAAEGSASPLADLAERCGVEFISAGVLTPSIHRAMANMGKDSSMVSAMLEAISSIEWFQWVVMMRKTVDSLNGSEWDFVVVDTAASVIMYYIMRQWKTDRVMANTSPLFSPLASFPPWPSPAPLSGLKEDMTFAERLGNEVTALAIRTVGPLMGRLGAEVEDALRLGEDYLGQAGVLYPELINTVIGFEYPRPIFPLMHYTGPLFMKNQSVLDVDLTDWLKGKPDGGVVYISMGSLTELTQDKARSILGGVMASRGNYSVVWALRDSNRNALDEAILDPTRLMILNWVPQFSMLQHRSVAMAILHCGIGGVQEALYNRVPVICIPSANDQFDTAARLEQWGLGVVLPGRGMDEGTVESAVEIVASGKFRVAVQRMSVLLRSGGGAQRAADLVELYREVGHAHGVPAYAKYRWSWIVYHKVDVYVVLFAIAASVILTVTRCIAGCYRVCFRKCTKLKQL